jgi:PAS domain S-box-containing protein
MISASRGVERKPSMKPTSPAVLPAPAALNEIVLTLVNHLDAMVAYWDINQVCVFANSAYLAWFGKTQQQMLGITLEGLLGPIYALNLPYIRAAYLGHAQTFEREIPSPDGKFRAALATYTPHVVDGTVRGIFVHIADVSSLKRLEQARRRDEERLELVLEATKEGAWDWNIQTGEVYFSPYWITSLGYDSSEVPRNVAFWTGLIHPDDMQRVQDALAQHLSGQAHSYECVNRLRRKDGTWRWNLDRGRVVERSADGQPLRMVGTDTDLSEQHWSGLKEIVAICAGCKSIRRDDGSWQAIEAHFGAGSLAQFSHGLCEGCVEKFYSHIAHGRGKH